MGRKWVGILDDLASRKPHPEDTQIAIEVWFIEVKGRAEVGEIALTTNEYKIAERLGRDYCLYAIFKCLPSSQAGASPPRIHTIQDLERLDWQSPMKVEHYYLAGKTVLGATLGTTRGER